MPTKLSNPMMPFLLHPYSVTYQCYHIGDWGYKEDIRRLIGIVCKFPEGQRFNEEFGVSMYPSE